jgi:hypothetical protein
MVADVMVTIRNPTLTVEEIPDHPGRRLLVVEFDLDVAPETASETDFAVLVTVRAVDLGDAPVKPTEALIELRRVPSPYGRPGHHRFERQVARVELDVEQDWWRSGPGGEVEPLGEFADHLVAEIVVRETGPVVAKAETQVLTGSWGALGAD